MENTIKYAWEAIEKECGRLAKKDPTLSFDAGKYNNFEKFFRTHYDSIMERFMRDTSELDSHKQAAIITVSCLESGAVAVEKTDEDMINIGPQIIALTVGLSYMNDRLNELLARKHLNYKIDAYTFPVAIACDTPYMEIMSRILYYEETEPDMQYNIMELSDRFFLLEYINLLQHGIEPMLLKD